MTDGPVDLGSGDRSRAHDFESMYVTGQPPWDIGRPQQAFSQVMQRAGVTGRVLDVGCGTGEHALMAAEAGLEAVGLDLSPTAISIAREKAHQRGTSVEFAVVDALHLESLAEQFDTVLDCGLFHTFDDPARVAYVDSLRRVTHPGSRLFLLGFSDEMPGTTGPRRLSESEIRDAFAADWSAESISRSSIEVVYSESKIPAWLADLRRV